MNQTSSSTPKKQTTETSFIQEEKKEIQEDEPIRTIPELTWFLQQLYGPCARIDPMFGNFETDHHSAFYVQRNNEYFFVRAFALKQDLSQTYAMLFEDRPAWYYASFRRAPREYRGRDLLLVEEEYLAGFHDGCRLDAFIWGSYGRDVAVSLIAALVDVLNYFLDRDVVFVDLEPSNLRVYYDSDGSLRVCPITMTNAICLKNIATNVRLNDGSVDWIRLGLPPSITTPETHNISICASQLDTTPFTYIQLKPVFMFRAYLTVLQIIFQDLSIANRVVLAISEVTMEEFEQFHHEQGYHDPYSVAIRACLEQEIQQTPSEIVVDGNVDDMVDFLSDIVGVINKVEHADEDYSCIEADRMEPIKLVSDVHRIRFQYMGFIDLEEFDPEVQARKLISHFYPDVVALVKKSNDKQILGNKRCVTFQATLNTGEHVAYRVFLAHTERGRHVFKCYNTIREEQEKEIGSDDSVSLALDCFPRVLGIDVFANVFVVREEWVNGMDLYEYLERVMIPCPNENWKKLEQVTLVQQAFVIVSLLHRWRFVHGDISACNLMVDEDGRLKIIDLESCVYLDDMETQARFDKKTEYFNYRLLNMWVKPNYCSFEIEYYMMYKAWWDAKYPDVAPNVYMTLEQIDAFALGYLSSEILGLGSVRRESCLNSKGQFCAQMFRDGVTRRWQFYFGRCPIVNGIFEALFRDYEVQHEYNCCWVISKRSKVEDLMEDVNRLVDKWSGKDDGRPAN